VCIFNRWSVNVDCSRQDVLFQKSSCSSIVAFKTLDISQGSVARHLGCGAIFSDSIIEKIYPGYDSEIILKICLYLVQLKCTK